ncbi:copper transport protein ATOX1 [Exaiptasia diaphana]|uniref:Copper transport protein ATOX1 n=1 Tax=Exaiptasia diaphana TaxID=2652724 RepID=A0A913XTV3_EXADI|nr:copper transport protein ATOX1 [Exaiptasia diaphana]KXJ09411.1 Copper transport protein ATOX1 [Exaiptasia diaphana]
MATKHEFSVEMTCGGCSGAVERVLGKVPEVSKVDIDMEKQRVYVTSDLPSDKLLEIIKKTGKATNYIGTA